MNDLETVIFDALYREGFSKAGSSGKHTEHLAKSVAREIEAHFAFVRRAHSPLTAQLEEDRG